MKIRNGFVSNSSSSSFIMRAKKFTQKELIETFGIEDKVKKYLEDGDMYDIFDEICDILPDSVDVEPTGNYFGEVDYDNIIIGSSCGYLDDGEVVEIPEYSSDDDDKIMKKLKDVGLKVDSLKTYVQMISNDNY